MNNEMLKTAMIVCTGVVFTTAVIAGAAAWAAANAWLTNRREARAAQQARANARYEHERETWIAMIAERDTRIDRLWNEIARLNKLAEFSEKLLTESENRRLNKEESC